MYSYWGEDVGGWMVGVKRCYDHNDYSDCLSFFHDVAYDDLKIEILNRYLSYIHEYGSYCINKIFEYSNSIFLNDISNQSKRIYMSITEK